MQNVLMFTELGPFFYFSDGGLMCCKCLWKMRLHIVKTFPFHISTAYLPLSFVFSYLYVIHILYMNVHSLNVFLRLTSSHVLLQIFYWITKLASFGWDSFWIVFTKGSVCLKHALHSCPQVSKVLPEQTDIICGEYSR